MTDRLAEAVRPAGAEEVRQIQDIAAGGREVKVTLRGRDLTWWWQEPGFAETEMVRGAMMSAAQLGEEQQILRIYHVARERPQGRPDGKNVVFELAERNVKPDSVAVIVDGVPRLQYEHFAIAENRLFFVRQFAPPVASDILVTYEYYKSQVYDACTRGARMLATVWLCAREPADHTRRWFDGDDVADGERTPRGGFPAVQQLSNEELVGIINTAYAEAAQERDLPNLPPSSDGADAEPSPEDTACTPMTPE